MKTLLFPYNTLNRDLDLTITNASLVISNGSVEESEPLDTYIDRQAKTINLWQVAEKKKFVARIDVFLSGAREELEPIIQAIGPLTAAVVVNCRFSKLRKSFLLHPSPTNRYAWEGAVEIDSREIAGLGIINGIVTGKAAGRSHRYIAETKKWTVYADSAYLPLINGALPVRWLDFSADYTYGDLRKFANEPYYINLELPIPEVYLNKGFDGLPELFSDQSRPKGSRLAVQETLLAAIAKSTWLALFRTSLDAVTVGIDGEEPSLPEQDWQVNVLQHILPKIYPGYSTEAALQMVVQDRQAGDMRRIETLASAVIGRDIVREGKAVRTAVHNLDLEYGGGE